jgi:ubiquinone/menaquinone biosynthesis C-methylase UbiE
VSEARPQDNEFVEFWNEVLEPKFNRFRDILMTGLSYHGAAALEQLHIPADAKVLDVGCGWGDTAIQLAKKVPEGRVLGLDCVDAFLEKGRADAKAAGLNNVGFVRGDVEVYPFEAEWDLCYSRFGMMFFNMPVAAMKNIFRALKPGGQLVFIVWRVIEDNPWFGVPKEIVLRFLPPPGDSAATCGPGPFSMASQDMVTKQLEIAGFTDVRHTRVDGPVTVGTDAEEAMQFQLALGPAGEIFREAGDEAEGTREAIENALREALGEHQQAGAW